MTLNEIDLGGFKYAELNEFKAKIEARMQEMRETGVPTLRERFAEEAAALGLTLDEVVASKRGKRGRPRKPRHDGEDLESAVA
jgi:hypothetical protein